MAAVRGGVSVPESTKEGVGEDEELTTNPFWGLVWAEDDQRSGSTVRGRATVHGGLELRFPSTRPRRS